jgi:hypothetical protein
MTLARLATRCPLVRRAKGRPAARSRETPQAFGRSYRVDVPCGAM